MQKRIKSFDRTKINYDIVRVKNKRTFLIFLHGLGGNLTVWKTERIFFHKKGISTLAIDLRGHGKSDRPNLSKEYDLENFAKDVYEVIKKEKISKFILVGHCFGGMVIVMFHRLFPKLAKSYVLIDTTHKSSRILKTLLIGHPFYADLLNRISKDKNLRKKYFSHADYSGFIGTGDWNIKRIYSDIVHTTLRSWMFTFQTISEFDGMKILKSIKQPVLVVQGEKDSIFNVSKAKKIHGLIKNSKLRILPNANHILVINNPDILKQEIYNYVNSIK